LIGYWPAQLNTPENAFSAIGNAGILQMVTAYEQGGQFYDPYGLPFMNTLIAINNSFGYWVKLNADYNDFIFPEMIWECDGSLADERDGQIYQTVMIGSQIWMAENLNIGIRINGENNQTNNGIIEKYCYNNLDSNCDVYGGLYQWDESMQFITTTGSIGICPLGWHLPTNDEWDLLSQVLGSSEVAGGKMKEAGTTHWVSPNHGATNSSCFTGLPGGKRNTDDSFIYLGVYGYYWSSSQMSTYSAWCRNLSYNASFLNLSNPNKSNAFSVRCIKDN
jgi:uncharacterized protein (TIGR02145 family)